MLSGSKPMRGVGFEATRGYLQFDVNGTSDPAAASFAGDLRRFVTSITYSATGIYTIKFNPSFGFAEIPKFVLGAICESGGTKFVPVQLGKYSAANRELVLQTLSGSLSPTAIAAPAAVGDASVVIEMVVNDSSAR